MPVQSWGPGVKEQVHSTLGAHGQELFPVRKAKYHCLKKTIPEILSAIWGESPYCRSCGRNVFVLADDLESAGIGVGSW